MTFSFVLSTIAAPKLFRDDFLSATIVKEQKNLRVLGEGLQLQFGI
jgi:hypothetical protein